MLVIVEVNASHDVSWAQIWRHAAFGWEGVYPEYGVVDKVDHHGEWYHLEWQLVPCGMDTLLDNTADVVFRTMPEDASSFRRGTNSPSMSMYLMRKSRAA